MKFLLATSLAAALYRVAGASTPPDHETTTTALRSVVDDILDHHGVPRFLQQTVCQTRLSGLVCELTTDAGATVKYTVNCRLGDTEASDCLRSNVRICYQYNDIPCIASTLCTPNGPIANDCSNIFAASLGDTCSVNDCSNDCVSTAPEPVDYNTADRRNTCMRAGFSTLGAEVGPSVIITDEWWHVLSDGQEIEVEAQRDPPEINYFECSVTYNGNPCSCSVACPQYIPPAISYDCGAFTDDGCAAIDCDGNCVNTPGPPEPVPVAPPTPAPVVAPTPAPVMPTAPTPVPGPPSCELMIHAFETAQQCLGDLESPAATGTIIPDGTCRSTGMMGSSTSNLLPGNYRAVCEADGRIRFLESGCTTSTCDPAGNQEVCDRDTTMASYLYSAPGTSSFSVFAGFQDFVDCTTITGSGIAVTFVILGTCSPECSDGSPPVTSTPVASPVTPPVTNMPVASPVSSPVTPPVTNPPVSSSPVTSPPVTPPPVSTPAPAKAPTAPTWQSTWGPTDWVPKYPSSAAGAPPESPVAPTVQASAIPPEPTTPAPGPTTSSANVAAAEREAGGDSGTWTVSANTSSLFVFLWTAALALF